MHTPEKSIDVYIYIFIDKKKKKKTKKKTKKNQKKDQQRVDQTFGGFFLFGCSEKGGK